MDGTSRNTILIGIRLISVTKRLLAVIATTLIAICGTSNEATKLWYNRTNNSVSESSLGAGLWPSPRTTTKRGGPKAKAVQTSMSPRFGRIVYPTRKLTRETLPPLKSAHVTLRLCLWGLGVLCLWSQWRIRTPSSVWPIIDRLLAHSKMMSIRRWWTYKKRS